MIMNVEIVAQSMIMLGLSDKVYLILDPINITTERGMNRRKAIKVIILIMGGPPKTDMSKVVPMRELS